jgi:hypothetical protein
MKEIAKQMAMAMLKKKKMAQGGWVEETPAPHVPDNETRMDKHFKMEEPHEPDLHGKGFSEDEIGEQSEEYDVEPGKFNKGGMCGYAEGGEVGPLAMLLRHKALKKMAYGGIIDGAPESNSQELSEEGNMDNKEYAPYYEQNMQTVQREDGTKSPSLKEAYDKDEDRVAFLRHLAVRRAMRGKAE